MRTRFGLPERVFCGKTLQLRVIYAKLPMLRKNTYAGVSGGA